MTPAVYLLIIVFFGCLTVIGQHPMKLLLSICLCPSVCPSLNFLRIGELVFSDIVHDAIADHNI